MPGQAFLTRTCSIFVFSTVIVALGFPPELWGGPTMCVGKPGIFLCRAKKRKQLSMKWVAQPNPQNTSILV